jgi:hypothetical protein
MFLFRKFNRTTITLLLSAAATLCLLISAGWFVYSYHLTKNALRATGHITQMIKQHSNDEDSWYPVYNFTDRDGKSYTIHSNIGSAPPQYTVGDPVTVLYYAGAGDDAHLDDWSTLWGIPLILLTAGTLNLLIAIGIALWPRFSRQQQITPIR